MNIAHAWNNIDDVRRQLKAPSENEPDWLAGLRNDIKELGQSLTSFASLPQAGLREYEIWLASLIQSLAEAKIAAADWSSLVASHDSLWLQLNDTLRHLQSIVGEELANSVFQQTRVDNQILQAQATRNMHTKLGEQVAAILRVRADEEAKAIAAHTALAYVQYNRDTAPPPAENFIKQKDDRFKLFTPAGDIVPGAIEAANYLATRAREEQNARDEIEKTVADTSADVLKVVLDDLENALDELGCLRDSGEIRLNLTVMRRSLLELRLNGREHAFKTRLKDIVTRYLLATNTLSYRAGATVEAIRRVYGPLSPDEILDVLLASVVFDDSDRGAQLEKAEIQLRRLQDWFGNVSARSKQASLAFPMTLAVDGDGLSGAVDVKCPLSLLRMRGVRLFSPYQAQPLPSAVTIRAPSLATQRYGEQTVQFEQGELVAELGYFPMTTPILREEGFWGAQDFRNSCPVGLWRIHVRPLFPEHAPKELKVILELLVDHLNR